MQDDSHRGERLADGEPDCAAAMPCIAGTRQQRQQGDRGMKARSWNSSTAKASRPAGVASRSRSASIGSTIAVEDSARPKPITTAVAPGDAGQCRARPASTAAVTTTCAAPSPSTERRMTHKRGRAQLQADQEQQHDDAELGDLAICSTSVTRRSPAGPMTRPATR